MGCFHSKQAKLADENHETQINTVKPRSLEDAVRHLRDTYQEDENRVKMLIDEIDLMRKEPQNALDSLAKDFADASGIDEQDTSPRSTDDGFQAEPRQPFDNVTLFDRMRPGTIKQPQDLSDLVKIVQDAVDQNKTVKAVGTCYAFSDVSFTTGTIIEMNRHLRNILTLDKNVLKDASENHVSTLLKAEAGAMIESLNDYLWPSHKRDKLDDYRTLPNYTGYQGLSLGGTIGTGAHGSGLNQPPISNIVESMHLITVGEDRKVKQYWIEPKNGITDPEKFKDVYGHSGWELIQDDDTFYSALVHIGCFGVVYSYTIRVIPAFYLQEERKLQTWDETKKQLPYLYAANLKPRSENGSLHSFEIWINPYPVLDIKTFKYEVYSVVTTYKWAEPPRKNHRPPAFSAPPEFNEKLRKFVVGTTKLAPWLIPEILLIALMATIEKQPVTMPCTEALDFGAQNSMKVVVSDMGIDADKPNNVIQATDKLIELFQAISKKNPHQFDTSPFSLRFTAPATAYVGPQYGHKTCMIEAPILSGSPGALDTLTQFRNLLMTQFSGRPHWGQINEMDMAKLKDLYPETWSKFMEKYNKFNKFGTFSNKFTASMGFSKLDHKEKKKMKL